MIIAQVQVSGTRCTVTQASDIPRGLVGATVGIEYTDSVWGGLTKTVVFRGCVTKDVLNAGEEVTIPAEVLSRAGGRLYMGVYGVDAENNVVIPTIWAELGLIHGAAAPSGDSSTDPALPVWAQIQTMIGNLDKLDTETKSNLVAAVNEALTKGGGETETVQPDWNQNDETAKDYVKNRPGGYAGDSIVWDGEIGDKVSVSLGDDMTIVKVSDRTLTEEQLIGATVFASNWGSDTITADDLYGSDDYIAWGETLIVVLNDNVTLNDVTFPQKGTYFAKQGDIYVSKIKSVVKIPSNYIDTSEIDKKISNAQSTAESAQSTAETAKTTAESAKTTAESAKTTAESAKTTAESAKTTAESAKVQGLVCSDQSSGRWFYFFPKDDPGNVNLYIGNTGYSGLTISVDRSIPAKPKVSFSAPVYLSYSSDFYFTNGFSGSKAPNIVGISGIILNSSTPNSTKQFKITVDDTGTISATEVTT